MGDLQDTTQPAESPFPLTEVDRYVLSLTDDQYRPHDWKELKQIIGDNNLSVLKRKPSDLRRYMTWTAETKAKYGSMTNYLLVHRLPQAWGSPPFTPASSVPFADKLDYCVLINDWPYGLAPDITHIVVWSRTTIDVDPETGDMTTEARQTVSNFVKRFFIDKLGHQGDTRVLWFKNWVALQSVRALEHIHVLIRDASDELLAEWTRRPDAPKAED
ncbi:hypothetical protein GGR50DRAFT_538842 [Xylaria sp. CBS 124048]|nr:hypothetical protein GGR50DRAFT_538842 [Xylaria sp. CBS 124048]